ncbi:MAG TPA: hypothetical protein VNU46_01645 [Gemmatimonadaceae bacterium]|nr:hypothetical protein [Gemmatimonadaceae bacterium]
MLDVSHMIFYTYVLASALGLVLLSTPITSHAQRSDHTPQTATVAHPANAATDTLVTVVPYEVFTKTKDGEPLRLLIPAQVDGWHARFVLDFGAPTLWLDRTRVQPSPTGGTDSITDANGIPERKGLPVWQGDTVHVTVRLGTLAADFVDPLLPHSPHHGNAVLNHWWGYGKIPRFGNIGLSVLEPYETIFDFPHHRLILIRLDQMGRRLTAVPAYTPQRTVPLIYIKDTEKNPTHPWYGWGVQARVCGVTDTLFIDTGMDPDYIVYEHKARCAAHLTRPNGSEFAILDHVVFAGRAYDAIPFDVQDESFADAVVDSFGLPFLSHLGVVGFNFRTRQLILYQ